MTAGFDPVRVLTLIDTIRPLLDRAEYHTDHCDWPDNDLISRITDARDALADVDPTGRIEQGIRRLSLGGDT